MGKNEVSNHDRDLKTIKERFYPGLFTPVLLTVISIAPYLWLFIDIGAKRYDRLLMLALFSGLGVSVITLAWTLYTIGVIRHKKEVRDYIKSPKTYEW